MAGDKTQFSSSAVVCSPQRVIYLSLELKTRSYNRDYGEEALKAFSQRPCAVRCSGLCADLRWRSVSVFRSSRTFTETGKGERGSSDLISVMSWVRGLALQIINTDLYFRLLRKMEIRADILV